ncbi:MAG: hypothetical protein DHS20C07_29440 [Methyloligella sp.]|nr:MAG: hypothetical protein DHS20C07_29440 [Methyloligella sp.]
MSKTLKRFVTKTREEWNSWAKGVLSKKEKLVKAGKWHVTYDYDQYGRMATVSADKSIPEIQNILNDAYADFSGTNINTFTGEPGAGGKWEEHSLANGKYIIEVTGIEPRSFNGYIFPGDVSFKDTAFEDWTQFDSARFHGLCDFTRAKFKGISIFNDAKFYKNTKFSETKFLKDTDFLNCRFYEGANFFKCEFVGEGNFKENIIHGFCDFGQSKFIRTSDFSNAKFEGPVYFQKVNFESHSDFSLSRFLDVTDFEAIQAKRGFNLAEAEFTSNIPNLIQANFTESPRLDNVKMIPAPKLLRSPFGWQRYFWTENYLPYLMRLSNRYFFQYPKHIWNQFWNTRRNPDEEAHYRALKRLAIQAHDHENEMKFFAGEIRSRRHITDFANFLTHNFASSMRYWAGVAYEAFSDFGRSFIRPALWWFACLWLFANLTLSNAGLEDTTKCHNSQLSPREAAYTIGLKNSLLILGLTKTNIVKQAELCLYGLNKNGVAKNKPKTYNPKIKRTYQAKSTKGEVTKTDIPFKAVWQGIIHSGLSLLFIFLLLLAIRNQFKIK